MDFLTLDCLCLCAYHVLTRLYVVFYKNSIYKLQRAVRTFGTNEALAYPVHVFFTFVIYIMEGKKVLPQTY